MINSSAGFESTSMVIGIMLSTDVKRFDIIVVIDSSPRCSTVEINGDCCPSEMVSFLSSASTWERRCIGVKGSVWLMGPNRTRESTETCRDGTYHPWDWHRSVFQPPFHWESPTLSVATAVMILDWLESWQSVPSLFRSPIDYYDLICIESFVIDRYLCRNPVGLSDERSHRTSNSDDSLSLSLMTVRWVLSRRTRRWSSSDAYEMVEEEEDLLLIEADSLRAVQEEVEAEEA